MRLFITGICQGAYDELIEEGLSESAKNIKALFDEELESEFQYSAYAACFSTLKDDAAQWERYGNGISGTDPLVIYGRDNGDRPLNLVAGAMGIDPTYRGQTLGQQGERGQTPEIYLVPPSRNTKKQMNRIIPGDNFSG